MEEIFENNCGSIGLLWGGVLVWWLVNGFYIKKKKRDLLQTVFVVGYLGKFLNWLFLIGIREFYDDKSNLCLYLLMGFKFSYIFGNTILFISLLIASKGFWIAKQIFDKEDIILVSFLSSITYIGFLLNFDYKFRLNTLVAVLVAIHFLFNVYCSLGSLNALKMEFEGSQEFAINRKPSICSFRRYIKISQLFLIGKIAILYLKENSNLGFYNGFDDLFEVFGFFSIYYLTQDEKRTTNKINQVNHSRFIPFYEATLNKKCEVFVLLNKRFPEDTPKLCIIEDTCEPIS
ncbi:unnamed protein product [Blepharisma stoltei]|uniref:Uncharacterized protein n=1 Tax=Blepharisma stoltei TaxID=1481888 RepID=A0AAU9K7U4_9CILI|nr:unnamed protein product [Blepharisma stoltei]